MTDVKSTLWPANTRLVRLGEIEIDLRYRRVSRSGAEYELNPRCFDLLQMFLREPRVLHTRDAIFRKVWRGAIVEDANLTTSIWLLRRALGGAAKQWIRTVSRQGYIFDPPVTVEFELLDGDEADAAALREAEPAVAGGLPTTLALPVPARTAAVVTAELPPRPAPSITRGWAMALAAAASLSLMLLTGGLLGARSGETAQRRIVLVSSADAGLQQAARWPDRLLRHWLDWQLRSVPQLNLDDPAAADAKADETVVLLEVGVPVQDSDWHVAVRFRGPSAPPDIVRSADADRLVAVIDEVSRAALVALTGTDPAATEAAPALVLDLASAALLAEGLEAEEQHRWTEAVRAYSSVLANVPNNGFARFRVARSLAQLGQQAAAQAELNRTSSWVNSLPAYQREPIQAEILALRQEYAAAARAYATLRSGGSEQPRYRIAEARNLRFAGRSSEAAERLNVDLPGAPDQAVMWLIERAESAAINRDFRNAARSAARARELAQVLGWDHESAVAALLIAEIQAISAAPVAPELFKQAEQGFTASGDRLGVLGARLRAELQRDKRASDSTLDQLLAEARSAGNPLAEIDALRRVASASYSAGDTREARRRYTQAAAVAESTGQVAERRRIDLLLLQQDTLRLDFAALDARLALLDSEPQQGMTAYRVGVNRARLQHLRGEFDAALRTLELTENRLREAGSGNLPQSVASLGCLRGSIHTARGHTADARTEYRNCRSTGQAALSHMADLGDADLAIQAGDLAQARELLLPMQQPIGDGTAQMDRWYLAMEVAPLFARIGDFDTARHLIDEVLSGVEQSGYHMIEANLRITRAEIALAEARPGDAEREVRLAEKLLPPDYWYERRRARTVRALIAQARGQTQAAAEALDALHADTRAHGDVLGELLVHSLMDANPAATRCSEDRRLRLLASSGMRGASDIWMTPAGRSKTRLVSAQQRP